MKRLSRRLTAALTFAVVGAGCVGGAIWAVTVIESRTEVAVNRELLLGAEDWARAHTDGLRVTLTGTAASEAARFRALALAGRVVDAARVIDEMTVTPTDPVAPPRFSVEVLRNDDGISLIGITPDAGSALPLSARIARAAPGAQVTDMLEPTGLPAPQGWDAAVQFGLEALARLPRSKISIAAGQVAITAISDSPAEKRRLEGEIAALVPAGISVALDISAPRPVIAPFTLRFIADENGMRFDACSAASDAGRKRILDAAVVAGATSRASCTLGLGVPSPRWAEAAALGIGAVAALGRGSVTFSDADVSLIADHTVEQATFDRVVGDLEARLPAVFSLKSVRQDPPAPPTDATAPAPTFTALRAPGGGVELRGRLPDALVRKAVDSFARAQFGADAVFMAARLDEGLPEGWPQRAFAGLQALAELHHGSMLMRADLVDIRGVSGKPDASDVISRILSEKLGAGQAFSIDVRYDEALDPLANLPTPEECVQQANDILTANKVNFDPGSANIEAAAGTTLNALADVLRGCPGVKMEIGGHTDSQGRAVMNLQLSQSRAEAVLHALMERRVLIGNLTAKGYGAEQPIAGNDSEEGREANRRIEFRLIEPAPDDGQEDTGAATDDREAADAAPPDGAQTDAADSGAGADAGSVPAATEDGGNDGDTPGGDPAEPVTVRDADDTTPRPRARPQ